MFQAEEIVQDGLRYYLEKGWLKFKVPQEEEEDGVLRTVEGEFKMTWDILT